MRPTIRPARPTDQSGWLEMWWDLVSSGPEPCAADAPALAWRRIMDPNNPLECLVADEAGGPVGFVLYVTHPYSWSTRPVCYLLDLYVRTAARGRGCGRALVEAVAARGRDAGWLKIYWMTQTDNQLAQSLYDKIAQRSSLVRYDLYLNPH